MANEAIQSSESNSNLVPLITSSNSGAMMSSSKALLQMSGPRKAAILCIALGEEVASEIFKHLTGAEVEQIAREVATINFLPNELSDQVVKEFHEIFLSRAYISTAGVSYAKKILVKVLGTEAANNMLSKITRSMESSNAFENMRKISPQQFSKLLQNEHPQTIALVLAHLDNATAAEVLGALPDTQRADLLMRMANLQAIPQDVIKRISVVLEQKLKSMGDINQKPIGGVKAAAEICNRLDKENSRKILETIEQTDSNLALSIRNLMVTFEDVLLLDDFGIREIIKLIDKKVLTVALKGAMPEIQARFFSNMSSRAVEMLKEDMGYLGQIKAKDLSAAQREIINIMRDLDEKGVISLGSGE
jgi:flagellar motor switch protein FliG